MTIDPAIASALGYVAAGCVFLAFCMKTMISLRLVAIASNVAFILYALAGHLTPILVLHGALLPLNVIRLFQMKRLVRMARAAASRRPGEERFDWLIPLGTRRTLPAGAMLFRKGDAAGSMYIVVEGELLLPEIDVTLGPGAVLGEISLFTGDSQRTGSAEAIGEVRLAELTGQRVQELYFDNPNFAYALVRLITRRLVENVQRHETRAGGRGAAAGGGR